MSRVVPPESRVCHILQDVSYGGVESLLVDLVRETNREFDHHVCHLSDRDEGASELREVGATVSSLDVPVDSPRAAFDPRSVPPLVRYLRRHNVDVVHTHFPLYPHVLGRVAASLAGVSRVVGTYHNETDDFHPLMRGVEWASRPLADGLTGVSEETADAFRTPLDGLLPSTPSVETIPDGIAVDAFNDRVRSVDEAAGRSRWSVDRDALCVLCVGRYAQQKAHEDLIEAVDRLQHDVPDVHLLLVGHGPLRGELEDAVADAGLEDSVTVAGPIPHDEIHQCYAAADAFALSSTSEGLGIALVEAMAAELPVVATDVSGPSDVVEDGETGHLVPPRRPDELADAVRRLTDEAERDRLGRNGYERAQAEFDIADVADAYATRYRM